jgi:hypothetical protein
MKTDVFDSYAYLANGKVMHFDVLVPSGTTKEKALAYAEAFLASVGVASVELQSMRCNFCHSEMAHDNVVDSINNAGHFILQMEGCPNPY